jgi:hypothetical protein
MDAKDRRSVSLYERYSILKKKNRDNLKKPAKVHDTINKP